MNRTDALKGYKPIEWGADSVLSADQRAIVEGQRKDLWRHGIRTEPVLTHMAFEFGAVICMQRAARKAGLL